MFQHFGAPRFYVPPVDKLLAAGANLGRFGVDLFFVLSGFLITGILLDTRNCENYWSSFYVRRALRIFPVYYAFLLFAWAVFPRAADPAWLPVRADWWLYPTYLSNWLVLHKGGWINIVGHFWSLAVEEQFYFVWPWVVLLVKPAVLPWLLAAAEILVIGARSWWVFHHGYTVAFGLLRIDGLLCGAIAACLVRERNSLPFTKTRLVIVAGTLLALAAMITRLHRPLDEELNCVGFGLWATGFTCLLVAAVYKEGQQSLLQKLLCIPMLRKTGKIAYGLYLFHVPINLFVSRPLSGYPDGEIIVGFVLSFGIATLSFNHACLALDRGSPCTCRASGKKHDPAGCRDVRRKSIGSFKTTWHPPEHPAEEINCLRNGKPRNESLKTRH